MNSVPKKPQLIVICGPTGIGKTSVGIELAEKLGGEIISADSMQIYRYMDIGTAKPTVEEKKRIPHHMIDIVDPDEEFDAVQFSDQARATIAELDRRGRIPVVVGGTGLYIKVLLHGMFPSQSIEPRIRNRLKKEAGKFGNSILYDRLKQHDPQSAFRLHPNDTYRIIRALEVFESTGKTIAAHHREHDFGEEPFWVMKIGLTMDRQALYERINRRVDAMVAVGFVDEVRGLLEMGFAAGLKSMQSIGYRHMAEFIERRLPWDECVRTLKRDTRRYAKRQLTWFGADSEIVWKEPEQLKEIMMLAEDFFIPK